MALGEFQIEWIRVPDGSWVNGRTLADCGFRKRTGVTVIAILRESESIAGAQPEDVILDGRHDRRRRQGGPVRRRPEAPRRRPRRRVAARLVAPCAFQTRQYPRVRSTSTGRTSRRPIHMRKAITSFEKSLKGS